MNILNIQMKKIEKLTQPQSFWGNSLQSRWVKENDSWLLLWVCFAQAVEDFGWAFKVRTRSGRDHPRVTCLQCLVKTVKMYPEIIHGMDFDSRCPSLTNMFTTLFTCWTCNGAHCNMSLVSIMHFSLFSLRDYGPSEFVVAKDVAEQNEILKLLSWN